MDSVDPLRGGVVRPGVEAPCGDRLKLELLFYPLTFGPDLGAVSFFGEPSRTHARPVVVEAAVNLEDIRRRPVAGAPDGSPRSRCGAVRRAALAAALALCTGCATDLGQSLGLRRDQ